jgi:predicted secreted protein
MALAKALKGKSLLIQVGDGEASEAFSHPCSLNSERGIVFSAETNQTRVPDCDDPEIIGWFLREKVAKGATINGAGTVHTPDVEDFFDWFDSDDTRNLRVKLNGVVLADGGGHWAGAFHCVGLEITGTVGEYTQVSLSLESSGAVTWVPAAA